MGHYAIETVALMPIKPVFANAIMSGTKKVEFRKIKFQRNVTHVVVYSSSPVQRVVGYFVVSNVNEDSPTAIWRQYKEVAGICHDGFRDYFRARQKAVAIEVGHVRKLSKPLKLSMITSGSVPQSFAYLNPNVLRRLDCLEMD